MNAINTVCPECGTKGVPILYGLPSEEGFAAVLRGEYVTGGCMPNPEENVGCPECGTKWLDPEYRDDGQ